MQEFHPEKYMALCEAEGEGYVNENKKTSCVYLIRYLLF